MVSNAQSVRYTMSNVHSHNDYKQKYPFYTAYKYGAGSIEADIYERGSLLIVSHMPDEVDPLNTLERLYLRPLDSAIVANHGFPYADTPKPLQLMIDIKTDGVSTLNALVKHLKDFPNIINCEKLTIAISGNQPANKDFVKYPAFIHFDGKLGTDYTEAELSKIVMLSSDFPHFVKLNPDFTYQMNDELVKKAVAYAHAHHKTIRLWDTPDSESIWKLMERYHFDYLNTDHIELISQFLNAQ